ncbi:MAG: N-acetylmuramoyl-L-alanine amidase [Rubrobacter sp.]|nr:N-acetylmuramoyl-L-alanine amidase [Rubrobacter sp.]
MARPDYGRARWYGAHSNGYTNASRPGANDINKIIIHITQGSWSSAINWFNDSRSGVSAHYVVRSSDGFIGQCVEEEDIPYHAGNWPVNQTSIGIEHEGYGNDPGWLTANLYNSSARLSAYLANKYNIPINRNHFLGHKQVSSTACPGNYWDWDRYLRLVRDYAGNSGGGSYRQRVDNASPRFRAGNAWGYSTYSSQKVGKNYRYTNPGQRGFASFRIKIPRRGRYAIFARWPANSGYNSRTRFKIKTASGWVSRVRNQRKNGGRWVKLGTFTMQRGDQPWVRVSRRSVAQGYIIADAVLVKEV